MRVFQSKMVCRAILVLILTTAVYFFNIRAYSACDSIESGQTTTYSEMDLSETEEKSICPKCKTEIRPYVTDIRSGDEFASYTQTYALCPVCGEVLSKGKLITSFSVLGFLILLGSILIGSGILLAPFVLRAVVSIKEIRNVL